MRSTISNPRGPGQWKFNSEILKENFFVQGMKSEIAKSERKYWYVPGARTTWELIKCVIRRFS